MKKLSIIFLFLINFIFTQSGGASLPDLLKNASIMVGMNQSFYGTGWNELIKDIRDEGTDVDQNPFRKLNFTLMNEFDAGVLGGLKYVSYGYNIKASDETIIYNHSSGQYQSDTEIVEAERELKFLKLFLTYPLNSGLYIGIEGGYFMEGESKNKINNVSDEVEIDRDMWTDGDFLEFDYGLLGQFYYNINENMLATIEGYYGLSKFSEENIEDDAGIPNVFHYANLGIMYKFGKN
tara:strand:+ start:331 stop:1038 length:708 start_codon:yes stop_codon:yes gene_type:complete